MSTEPHTVEPEDESEIILGFLKAERVGPNKPVLAVHELALLRRVAHMLATDSGDAKDIASLLELAPRIISPGARPAPTLAQLCAPEREWDLSALSTEQVLALDEIAACAQGKVVCPSVQAHGGDALSRRASRP